MVAEQRNRAPEPLVRVRDESMIVQLARQVATRHGDPYPELIQHAVGSREEVTRTTGSIVFSDEPSYIIVIKGKFRARRPSGPRPASPRKPAFVSYPFQVLVVNMATGLVTDSGSTHACPDLTPLGPVITDHPVAPDGERTVGADLLSALMDRSTRVEEIVEVRYRGPATVGSPGRARLHGRDGGIAGLVWYALGQSGWLGHTVHLKPTLEVTIRVAPVRPGERPAPPRFAPLPGGPRRRGESGVVSEDGTVTYKYAGSLHPRAAGPGVRLVETEGHAEDFDAFEDMLYRAAAQADWLSVREDKQSSGEVPDAEILIRLLRRPP